jgi:hypothetical protein
MGKIIFAALIGSISGAAAGDVAGSWKVVGSIGEFPVNLVCSFKEANSKLTGSCKGDDIGELAVTGDSDGKTAKWSYSVNFQGMPLTVVYMAMLDSPPAMTGKISVMENESGSFTGKKQN